MRDGNGAAYDESDIQGVDNFVALPAFLAAAHKMVGDTVITAEHRGSNQAEQFLGFGAELAGFIGLVVQGEEALHAQVAAAQNLLVQVSSKFLKILQAIGHGSSEKRLAAQTRAAVAIMNDLQA